MISVAIDGPAGAGKSTISRHVAKALGFIYVDTGALYRTVALHLLNAGIAADDEAAIEAALPDIKVDLRFIDGEQHMFLNDKDVTDLIRTPEVSMMASRSSAVKCVRAYLLNCQRDLACRYNVVMDGRDIGTVVLPQAQIKIFLTADPEDRARRRYDEMIAKGMEADYEAVLADLKERDYNDSHRPIAPLKPAEGSVIINTTGFTFEGACELLLNTIKERL
ncbi:MAG: (d)CMP kinase [Clostridia bacterium]|nr:(d)CMP kinase [Clostridia bacterium]